MPPDGGHCGLYPEGRGRRDRGFRADPPPAPRPIAGRGSDAKQLCTADGVQDDGFACLIERNNKKAPQPFGCGASFIYAERLADQRVVVALDRHDGRPRQAAVPIRERAARVLDAHEHGAFVRRPGQTRHLGAVGARQEAADFTRHRVARQHLVVAHAFKLAFVVVIAVRLDPHDAGGVEHHPVRRVEHVAGVDIGRSLVRPLLVGRIARHDKEVPFKGVRCVVVARRTPAHDLAKVVDLAWVGPVWRGVIAACIGFHAAVFVVGQTAIGFDRAGVDGDPFGTVHRGGPNGRGRRAGKDRNLGLRHAGGCRGQGDPFAGQIVVELRHIKLPFTQQSRCVATGHIKITAQPFIHEFATLIIAHIDDKASIGGHRVSGVFVFETAQSGVFDWRRSGICGINLDDVSDAVWLVRVLADVKAGVPLVIVIAPTIRANAVPLVTGSRHVIRGQRACGTKIAVKVLFAGQIRAPGRATRAAIVHRTKRLRTGRVGFGFQQVMPCGRPVDDHRRVVGDASVIGAVDHNGPTIVPFGQFKDCHALKVLQAQDITRTGGNALLICGQVDFAIRILAVHGKDFATAHIE
mmetsp:Transcript_304/g.835  ORF Transcript_304/g.835 Transcript_304/m.835 type:complete len:579 (+) Transcript_304:301-2037(+)